MQEKEIISELTILVDEDNRADVTCWGGHEVLTESVYNSMVASKDIAGIILSASLMYQERLFKANEKELKAKVN